MFTSLLIQYIVKIKNACIFICSKICNKTRICSIPVSHNILSLGYFGDITIFKTFHNYHNVYSTCLSLAIYLQLPAASSSLCHHPFLCPPVWCSNHSCASHSYVPAHELILNLWRELNNRAWCMLFECIQPVTE